MANMSEKEVKKETKTTAKKTVKKAAKTTKKAAAKTTKKNKEVNIESSDGKYFIQGVVNDKGGSIEKAVLLSDGKVIITDEEGGFLIEGKTNKSFTQGGNSHGSRTA